MLPAPHRLRRAPEFSSVVRGGTRVRARCLVVHQRRGPEAAGPARVGLIVGKTVGPSVVRHRVSRRLRAQLAARVALLPPGSMTVVRALPPACDATSAELGTALDRALPRVADAAVTTAGAGRRPTPGPTGPAPDGRSAR